MPSLNSRALEIFGHIVQMYMRTGDPVGSSFLHHKLGGNVSSATIRNVMSFLQEKGLLKSLHVSSGRMPTEAGLRFFVNGMLKQGCLSKKEKTHIEERCRAVGHNMENVLHRATRVLSGLSHCTGLVLAQKHKRIIEYMECIDLPDGNALMIMVGDKGYVENRIIHLPQGVPFYLLKDTVRVFNQHFSGRTLEEAVMAMKNACVLQRGDVQALMQAIVRDGLGYLFEDDEEMALLLTDQQYMMVDNADSRVEEARELLSALHRKTVMKDLLDTVDHAQGIQIFIGSENHDFTRTGCSMVVAGVRGMTGECVGVLGVIGPTRMDYARVIPLVDYTARMVGSILDECDGGKNGKRV